MKIKYNGKYFILENQQEKEDMLDMECVCSHDLRSHYYHNTPLSRNTFETGRCKNCDCLQFKLTGRIETQWVSNYVQG